MKYIFMLIVFVVSLTAIPILARQNLSRQEAYHDCILEHLKNAKVDLATQLIKRACKENYKDFRISSNNRQEYNECLLEYLPGIESRDAAQEIQKTCKDKHL